MHNPQTSRHTVPEVIKMKKNKKKEPPLGIPVEDPPVPNRAHTEMRLPGRSESPEPSRPDEKPSSEETQG